jgi:hypothetical protein
MVPLVLSGKYFNFVLPQSLHKTSGFRQPKSCNRTVINTKLTLAMERSEENELEELVIPIWHNELEGLRSHVVLRWSRAGKYNDFQYASGPS